MPDLTPVVGEPVDLAVVRNASGLVLHRFGRVTGSEWWTMLHNVLSDRILTSQLMWYEAMSGGFLAIASNDPSEAAKLTVAYGAGSIDPSYETAERWVLSRIDAVDRGELHSIRDKMAGLRAASVRQVLEEGRLSHEGIGQYRMDFIDALIRSRRRTVPIHGPDPGNPWQPAPFGLWSKRDVGYIDAGMARQLKHLFQAGSVTYGRDSGYLIEWDDRSASIPPAWVSGSKVSSYEYDYGLEFYNARKDEANSLNGGEGLFGRTDWTAAGMVAAGWLRVNRVMGTVFWAHPAPSKDADGAVHMTVGTRPRSPRTSIR